MFERLLSDGLYFVFPMMLWQLWDSLRLSEGNANCPKTMCTQWFVINNHDGEPLLLSLMKLQNTGAYMLLFSTTWLYVKKNKKPLKCWDAALKYLQLYYPWGCYKTRLQKLDTFFQILIFYFIQIFQPCCLYSFW